MQKQFDAFFNYIKSFDFLLTMIIIISAIVLMIVISKTFKNIKKKSSKRESTTVRVVSEILRYVIVVGALLLVLQANGINVSSLFAGLGLASAIVGLALQDFLKDMITGIHIMTDHFYGIGDGVVYNGEPGIICGFNLRTTKIQTLDGSHIISVCNREFSNIKKLSNVCDIDIPLSYKEDVKKVFDVMKDIAVEAKNIDGVISSSFKGTQTFDDSAIYYRLRLMADPYNQPDVRRAANRLIQDKLAEANIEIPFNQLDVHLDGGNNG